jgi:hypothetical protein
LENDQSSKIGAFSSIFVYLEDAPVHRDVVAHGLHRAGPPILRSIEDHIDQISIYQVGRRFKTCALDQVLAPHCRILPRIPTLLCKALCRYPAVDFGMADLLPPLILAKGARKSPASILLSLVGADVGTLVRAARLASLSRKFCSFYIVDDFLSPLRIAGAKEDAIQKVADKARTALRGAKHVFAITDGLGEYLTKQFGVSARTLNLAFEREQIEIQAPKNQIIYVGSINFLYAGGLRDLFHTVEHVRIATGIDLTVRLTLPAEVAAAELGVLPPFVVSMPAETSESLAGEIASSLFAFLPSSFNMRERAMVTTSFPSKLMEYLAYARSIVVYGPDYGVATRVFLENGLPSVVSSKKALEKEVHFHLAALPEHSWIYRNYLVAAHSLAAARRTLCEAFGLEIGGY